MNHSGVACFRLLAGLAVVCLLAVSCSNQTPASPTLESTDPIEQLLDQSTYPYTEEQFIPSEYAGLTDERSEPETMSAADAYDADIAVDWFYLAYESVKAEGWTPPVASRTFGYAGVTLYEAIQPGIRGSRSLRGQLNDLNWVPPAGLRDYHWPTVANNALATIMAIQFSEGSTPTKAAITALQKQYNDEYKKNVRPLVYFRSVARGLAVGLTIAWWAKQDGYDRYHDCTNVTIPSGPQFWVPTPPAFLAPLEPCWGELRTFALDDSRQCDPGVHPAYSEDPASAFFAEGTEVYDVSMNLTAEQMTVANYWADNPGATGTPPGHSISIACQIMESRSENLSMAGECFAKLGIAVADAFISCWRAKYDYNLLRPITYIQRVIDPAYLSPIGTPNFPEYTSGHSVQSGAFAAVMTDLFGNVPFTDHTHASRGFAPRSFDDFYDAANEAAISRLYGGIHYRSAIDLGISQGMCVGEQVNALHFRKGKDRRESAQQE